MIHEVFMKNLTKFPGNLNRARSTLHQRCAVPLLIIAFVAVIGFTMIACSNGGGGGNPGGKQPVDPLKEKYVSYDDKGIKYELVITEATGGRALVLSVRIIFIR